MLERARELLYNCEDIEVQNIFSDAISYLKKNMNISTATAQRLIYNIEEKDDKHWLRKNDYQAEFTNWLRENNCYCTQTEDSKTWRKYYYKYLKMIGRHKITYDRPNIGQKVYELYGLKVGDKDFNKYYSRLYKEFKNNKKHEE